MFQIETHNFTVISADSIAVKPFTADTLYITSGDSLDQNKSHGCLDVDAIEEYAVLRYHRKGDAMGERSNIMQVQSEAPDDDLFPSHVVSWSFLSLEIN